MTNLKKYFEDSKQYSIVIIRLGLAFVFLWFGINQLIQPDMFLGYVPSILNEQNSQLSLTPQALILLNGIFEIIIGFLLLIGFKTKIIALLAALNLLSIILTGGYNDIAIRDFGLTAMAVSLMFSGAGKLSFDNRHKE